MEAEVGTPEDEEEVWFGEVRRWSGGRVSSSFVVDSRSLARRTDSPSTASSTAPSGSVISPSLVIRSESC